MAEMLLPVIFDLVRCYRHGGATLLPFKIFSASHPWPERLPSFKMLTRREFNDQPRSSSTCLTFRQNFELNFTAKPEMYPGQATTAKCAIPWPYPGHSRIGPGYGQV